MRRALVDQKAFRGKLWEAFGMEHFERRMWERTTKKKKRGPDRSWQIKKVSGKMERAAGGNKRRRTRRISKSKDVRFEGVLMRQAYNAEKSGDWADYLEVFLGKSKQGTDFLRPGWKTSFGGCSNQ